MVAIKSYSGEPVVENEELVLFLNQIHAANSKTEFVVLA